MAKRPPSLEDWEVSLVRAMFSTGRYRKQDIHPYFTRAKRSINQARISQIVSGKYRPGVPPASEVQLENFLATYSNQDDAKRSFTESDPLHPIVAIQALRIRAGLPLAIEPGESDWTEFKAAFNWSSRAPCAKTMAGLSNNRGGYLAFGVNDQTREIVGLKTAGFANTDPAKVSQFLNQHFAPAIRWDKAVVSFNGIDVGLIYVWQCATKPVVCSQGHGDDLREADIYYRYVGYTARIKYPELQQLFSQRDSTLELRWQKAMGHIRSIGIERAAIMDTDSGIISGPSGSFVIDAALLPKLNFVRDGQFAEKHGSPVLKLIGHVRPVSGSDLTLLSRIEHRPLNDREIVGAFIEQRVVSEPLAYVSQLCHIQPLWMPVYFFIHLAGIPLSGIISHLSVETSTHAGYKSGQIDRLKKLRRTPPVSKTAYSDARVRLLSGVAGEVSDPSQAMIVLRSMRTLRGVDASNMHVLPVLRECFEKHYGGTHPKLTDEIRYAATHLDFEMYGRRFLPEVQQ